MPPSFVQCCKAPVLDEPYLAQYRFCSPPSPLDDQSQSPNGFGNSEQSQWKLRFFEKGFCDQVSCVAQLRASLQSFNFGRTKPGSVSFFVTRVKMAAAADELTYFSTEAADQVFLNTFVIAASLLIESGNYEKVSPLFRDLG